MYIRGTDTKVTIKIMDPAELVKRMNQATFDQHAITLRVAGYTVIEPGDEEGLVLALENAKEDQEALALAEVILAAKRAGTNYTRRRKLTRRLIAFIKGE